MNEPGQSQPVDWSRIRLAVFDVDGTLYDQRRLRLRMARDIVLHVLLRGEYHLIPVLRAYRRIREHLGEGESSHFETQLLEETARRTGCAKEQVRALVAEWMERRPLPHLAGCRYAGLPQLFHSLHRHGIAIGVFSDYPAREKMAALALDADHIVWAGEPDVGMLKPHPRGLEVLMKRAGIGPEATVLIGDRVERDGMAARRCGVQPLIRSPKSRAGWQTFTSYADTLFTPLLTE